MKDGSGQKMAPYYPPSSASKHKNLPDLLYRQSYRSNSKDDHMQEVPSLDQILEEMDFDGLRYCGKKPSLSQGTQPFQHTKRKCETPKAQREQFVRRRDLNKEIFSTSLLQVQTQKGASLRYSK